MSSGKQIERHPSGELFSTDDEQALPKDWAKVELTHGNFDPRDLGPSCAPGEEQASARAPEPSSARISTGAQASDSDPVVGDWTEAEWANWTDGDWNEADWSDGHWGEVAALAGAIARDEEEKAWDAVLAQTVEAGLAAHTGLQQQYDPVAFVPQANEGVEHTPEPNSSRYAIEETETRVSEDMINTPDAQVFEYVIHTPGARASKDVDDAPEFKVSKDVSEEFAPKVSEEAAATAEPKAPENAIEEVEPKVTENVIEKVEPKIPEGTIEQAEPNVFENEDKKTEPNPNFPDQPNENCPEVPVSAAEISEADRTRAGTSLFAPRHQLKKLTMTQAVHQLAFAETQTEADLAFALLNLMAANLDKQNKTKSVQESSGCSPREEPSSSSGTRASPVDRGSGGEQAEENISVASTNVVPTAIDLIENESESDPAARAPAAVENLPTGDDVHPTEAAANVIVPNSTEESPQEFYARSSTFVNEATAPVSATDPVLEATAPVSASVSVREATTSVSVGAPVRDSPASVSTDISTQGRPSFVDHTTSTVRPASSALVPQVQPTARKWKFSPTAERDDQFLGYAIEEFVTVPTLDQKLRIEFEVSKFQTRSVNLYDELRKRRQQDRSWRRELTAMTPEAWKALDPERHVICVKGYVWGNDHYQGWNNRCFRKNALYYYGRDLEQNPYLWSQVPTLQTSVLGCDCEPIDDLFPKQPDMYCHCHILSICANHFHAHRLMVREGLLPHWRTWRPIIPTTF